MLWQERQSKHLPFAGNNFTVAITETWNLTETVVSRLFCKPLTLQDYWLTSGPRDNQKGRIGFKSLNLISVCSSCSRQSLQHPNYEWPRLKGVPTHLQTHIRECTLISPANHIRQQQTSRSVSSVRGLHSVWRDHRGRCEGPWVINRTWGN